MLIFCSNIVTLLGFLSFTDINFRIHDYFVSGFQDKLTYGFIFKYTYIAEAVSHCSTDERHYVTFV